MSAFRSLLLAAVVGGAALSNSQDGLGREASAAGARAGLEARKAIARKEVEVFEGRGDLAVGNEVFADGYRLHFAGNPPMDRAGHEAVLASFRAAFPDLSIVLVGQVADGDRVANHILMTGTHGGPFQGMPATGKTVRVSGTNVMRFEQDRIVELWGQLDLVSMMQQLGAMPTGPEAAIPIGQPLSAPSTTKPGDAVAAVRRFVAHFNEHDPDAASRDFGAAYVLDFPGGPTGRGVEGAKEATGGFMATFPDLVFTTEDLFGEADRVLWRWTLTGTQQGPMGPFPASGNAVRVSGISLLRVADGKIVEDRVRADVLGMYAQIGALPPQ